MPTYNYPGVYIQEVNTGNKPIEGVSTSIVGFLGVAERGPTAATFLTSYADFVRAFGVPFKYKIGANLLQSYLAYAVEGFFQNGGQQCWVARVTSIDAANPATTATAKIGTTFSISAAGPGSYASQLGYLVTSSSTTPADPT